VHLRDDERVSFAGAVLTGGRSRRMGRDKATLPVDGVPLGRRVADVLLAAGASEVVGVGGDVEVLTDALGMEILDDLLGEGPLGGVALALEHFATADAVAVLGCDLVGADPAGVRALVAALDAAPAAVVAVPVQGGVRQVMHSVWRPAAAGFVRHALDAGDRSVQSVLDRLQVVEVRDLDPAWLRDADLPDDLPH
jgi:molybdopterin-guanine dinucleotide biosynthesis protein A